MTDTDKQSMLILSGLPAAGKTMEALRWVAEDKDHRERISYNDLRTPGWTWSRADEYRMKARAREQVIHAIGAGKSVVIDNCNLKQESVDRWITLARAAGLPYEVVRIETQIDECIARDRNRGTARVGRAVIDDMALRNGIIDWSDKVRYKRDFIIVDIDGTVSDTAWRTHLVKIIPGVREEKDWKSFHTSCGDDAPIRPILELVRLSGQLYDIIIITGRPVDLCGVQTEEWLYQHMPDFPVRHLFMAPRWSPSEHGREAHIFKAGVLKHLPKERIAYIFEDRSSVVKMWRTYGLTCLQVADGEF